MTTERVNGVLVIGGGIAGIAAAVGLSEQGVPVTLLETRKKLGGRATSFTDVRSGEVLDNCQHVVLGCCTNYLDLLGRLDVADKIRWHDEQYWVEEGGRVSVLRPGPCPTPLHFVGSILRAKFMSAADVGALSVAIAAILRADRTMHEHETFGAYLARLEQPEAFVRRFWSPVIVSACNMDVDRVSASAALHVFQEGFLANRAAARIGVPSVPLVQLYERVESIIAAAGGRVVLGEGVAHVDDRGAATTEGRRYDAQTVICAVPVERVNRIVDERLRMRDPRFARLDLFTHSPILGVHLQFAAPVMHFPHAVLVDRPTQWLFRKDDEGRYLHAVISAADQWVALTEDEIGRRVLEDVRACFPAARGVELERARAVKEKLATFAPVPGIDRLRPATTGPGSSLILAGDFVKTGWPATMEGATRSGYMAAAAVLGKDRALVPPLKVAPMARLMGLLD
jgi:hydroxysqualene dehydroxylase